MGAPYPRIPVRLGGTNELHAAFLNESRTRCSCWRRVQEIRGISRFWRDVGPHPSEARIHTGILPKTNLFISSVAEGSAFYPQLTQALRKELGDLHGFFGCSTAPGNTPVSGLRSFSANSGRGSGFRGSIWSRIAVS